MSLNYQVGKFYTAKTYKESGYNFPEGKYKLKGIYEIFPDKPINNEDELLVAKELWLEGSDQYQIDLEGNWYYFKFPKNNENIDYMWIPESVVVEVFNY